MKYLFIALLLVSCGARKVSKSQTKEQTEKKEKIVVENDITAYDNITITAKSFVIDSTKEEIEELIITPIDILKPAYYENKELTNTKLVKRKIKRNKNVKEESNTNAKAEGKTIDKSKINAESSENNKKSQNTKNVDQKQFNILSLWWLWLLILIVIYLLYCYFKKLNPLKFFVSKFKK